MLLHNCITRASATYNICFNIYNRFSLRSSDVLGIKVGLQCHPSKFTLNNSVDHDRHWLTRDGLLMGKGFDPKEYCLEAFDQRNCQNNDDVIVTAVVCFVPAVLDKNFLMAAVVRSSLHNSIFYKFRLWLSSHIPQRAVFRWSINNNFFAVTETEVRGRVHSKSI